MIYFSNNLQGTLESLLSPGRFDAVFALTDNNTKSLAMDVLSRWVKESNYITIPSGDENKTLETATAVWQQLIDNNATRKSCLINLGGGVVSDLGGFCAATYMRGIACINIPTSLLAMVDASVGAKNGINMGGMKNYIGTFTDPIAVIINSDFLQSLDKEHLINGWAEVLKHAIIGGSELWNQTASLTSIEDKTRWNALIASNIDLKKRIVDTDLHESGLRKVLNLGHTLGHALETWFIKQNLHLDHGRAVAAGILIESAIAAEIHILKPNIFEEIRTRIDSVFERIPLQSKDFPAIVELLKKDKKNAFGKINMSLPCDIGTVQFDIPVELEIIQNALENYAKPKGSPAI